MTTARPEFDTEIKFHTPPANQGQAVTVSYAAAYPWVIRHVHDRSDNSNSWDISKMLKGDEGDYWNDAPANKGWRQMTADEMVAFGLL